MRTVDVHTLEPLVLPVVEGLGYELVELEWKHEAGAWVLRLYLDHSTSPVSLDDCSKVSRALSAELDVADAINVPYTLEVSSPGLDRPLRKERDFARFAGRKAKIRTRHPVGTISSPTAAPSGGRRNFSGKLVGADGGKVRIDVDGTVFEIPVDDVEKANLQYEGEK